MKESARRVIRFGMQNYFRNGWLSLAATFVVSMTLFIVTVFVLQTYVIKATTKSIQAKLDMALYLNDEPNEDAVAAFVAVMKGYPEVKEVEYLNKQQVIEEWNKLHVDQKIKNQVNAENNPLPRTIKIKTYDPSDLDKVYNNIKDTQFNKYIRNISYGDNRPVIQQLIAQSKKTTRNGLIVSSIFIVIATLFVYNTIRIIIRFRQDEIAIMKLVGATDSFVQGPFIVEGALYGVVAGIITLIALYFYLQNGLPESSTVLVSPDMVIAERLVAMYRQFFLQISTALISSAVLLAVFCSWISVQLHLKR